MKHTRVLIVDDNEIDLIILSLFFLEPQKFLRDIYYSPEVMLKYKQLHHPDHIWTVDKKSDPLSAFETTDVFSYDFIITDLAMIFMTGDVFIRKLAAMGYKNNVCLLTSSSSREIGVFDDIDINIRIATKPLTLVEFVEIFGSLCEEG